MAKRDGSARDVECEVMTQGEVDALRSLNSIAQSLDKIATSLHTIDKRFEGIEDRLRQIASLLLQISQQLGAVRAQGFLDTLALSIVERMRGS